MLNTVTLNALMLSSLVLTPGLAPQRHAIHPQRHAVLLPAVTSDYTLIVDEPAPSHMKVRAVFRSTRPQPLRLTIGQGGNYPFQKFGDYVEKLSASVDGCRKDARRVARDVWALPPGKSFAVQYEVRMDQIKASPRQDLTTLPYVGKDFITFPTIGVFLRPTGAYVTSVKVRFDLPALWHVATTMAESGDGAYSVPKPANFAGYSFVALGDLEEGVENLDGTTITAVLCGNTYGFPKDRFGSVATRAVREVRAFYGSLPEKRLMMIAVPRPGSKSDRGLNFGGTVSRSIGMSMMLMLDEKQDEAALKAQIGRLITHETFHLGNPATSAPETWFIEGFTTYYDAVLSTRAGFNDEKGFVQRIAEASGNDRRMPPVSLIDAAKHEFEGRDYYQDVYSGGALLAFQLDVAMRRAGKCSLDDLMRALYRVSGLKGKPVTVPQIVDMAKAMSGVDMQPMVDKYVKGNEWPSAERTLAGMGWTTDVASRHYDLGLQIAEQPAGLTAVAIRPGGPGAKAGVQQGDVLTAFGDVQVHSFLDYLRATAHAPTDGRFHLTLSRQGAEVAADVTPTEMNTLRVVPQRGDAPDRGILEAILTG